jgi:DNA-directed RNA polymerase subunit RPC12/RpoP
MSELQMREEVIKNGLKMTMIKDEPFDRRDHEGDYVVTAAVREVKCEICGHKITSVFVSDRVNDDPEQVTDHLIEEGWSVIDKKLACPKCAAECNRSDAV